MLNMMVIFPEIKVDSLLLGSVGLLEVAIEQTVWVGV